MLRPHDLILTHDKIIFVVQNYEALDGYVIALPKYAPYQLAQTKFKGQTWRMLGNEWSRINNPLDPASTPSAHIKPRLLNYRQIKYGYLIDESSINQKFYGNDAVRQTLAESMRDQNHVRQQTSTLLNLLRDVVGETNLGLTGSSALRGEIDGFSDIDILVYGFIAYNAMARFFRYSSPSYITWRTLADWEKFYDDYKVICGFGRRAFARHMIDKYDQFIIDGVSVSVFAVRNSEDMKWYQLNKKERRRSLGNIKVEGIVVDDSESMFMPSFYEILTSENQTFVIRNDCRAYLFQAIINCPLRVEG